MFDYATYAGSITKHKGGKMAVLDLKM